jgi:predicted RND superfamily exporter protein
LLLALPLVAVAVGLGPRLADAIVAMRPAGLRPLQVQQQIYDAFGGRTGQWVVMVRGDDAHERNDRIAEALVLHAEHIESVDTLSSMAPAPSTQRARLSERDGLRMTDRADALALALKEVGFAPDRFVSPIAAMRAPSHTLVELDELRQGDSAIMMSRYLGEDAGQRVIVSYVLPRPGHEAAVEEAIRAAEPSADITGYGRLERSLRATLAADLPRIGGVAALLVLLSLALSLRRKRDVGLAAAVVACEIGVVLWLVRVFDVPLHAYDALVLPVLLGITVDEAMFLLFRAREVGDSVRETLRHEGPPIATTALTTAAGFAGLIICDFDGLRHLGIVGAIGSLAGLVVALIIIPAGLRLTATGANVAPEGRR